MVDEEMIVTRIFSFTHIFFFQASVSKLQKCRSLLYINEHYFLGPICFDLEVILFSFKNIATAALISNINLDSSEMKAFAGDNENPLGKGQKTLWKK